MNEYDSVHSIVGSIVDREQGMPEFLISKQSPIYQREIEIKKKPSPAKIATKAMTKSTYITLVVQPTTQGDHDTNQRKTSDRLKSSLQTEKGLSTEQSLDSHLAKYAQKSRRNTPVRLVKPTSKRPNPYTNSDIE